MTAIEDARAWVANVDTSSRTSRALYPFSAP